MNPAPALETNDLFATGPVTLQKTAGSALVNAVGTIRNNSDRQRFGIKIELDLLDEQDNKIGTAGDYLAILEPHKDWQFRALLTQPGAVKATVAKIEEQK
ncbi:MAG: FxLYD domain-containing protein [Verrucomicrobiia bacterium]